MVRLVAGVAVAVRVEEREPELLREPDWWVDDAEDGAATTCTPGTLPA
jgi:hypothetical protein